MNNTHLGAPEAAGEQAVAAEGIDLGARLSGEPNMQDDKTPTVWELSKLSVRRNRLINLRV